MAATNTTNNSSCVGNSLIKTTEVTFTFVWNIQNFSGRNQETGKCLDSGIFNLSSPSGNPLKWRLKLYPRGSMEEAKDHLSLFICLVDSAANEVSSRQTYWIKDSKGEDRFEKEISINKFIKNKPGYGIRKFIERSVLLNDSSVLLPNDQLTIVCELTVYGEETVECSQTEFRIPECRAFENMSNFYDKNVFTDLVLVASSDGKEFKVHKCILASHSPVFAAMFQHDLTESKEGVVKIDDIESAVLEQTLRFIYGGTTPKLAEMAEELLVAADKYQLDRLKVLCEGQLANSIGTDNACKLLALAHRHSAKNLKAHAIKFIKEKAKEVVASDGWKMLKANHADLVDQLFIVVCRV